MDASTFDPLNPPEISAVVVDDHADTRQATVTLLKTFGVRAHGARGGAEALDRLLEVRPDLILRDLHMPRVDGLEFVQRLRRTVPLQHVLTVAVTEDSRPEALAAIRAARFDAHVVKPMTLVMSADLLDRAVDVRRRRSEGPEQSVGDEHDRAVGLTGPNERRYSHAVATGTCGGATRRKRPDVLLPSRALRPP